MLHCQTLDSAGKVYFWQPPVFLCNPSQASLDIPGDLRWMAIFRALWRSPIGFKSRIRLSHSATFTEWSPSHLCAVFTVHSGSLSHWKVNLHPSLSPLVRTFIWASEKRPSRVPVGMTLGSACLSLKTIQRIRVKAFSLGLNGSDSTASLSIPKPLPFNNNGRNSWVPSA